jgi:replicative DNA helicase
MTTEESIAFEKGLPVNLDAERLVLGSVLLNGVVFAEVAAMLSADDFSLEKHRRIFARMTEIARRGEPIDRVVVANELMRQGQLESVDGLGYLVSLDDGLPEIANLGSYIRIVREKSDKRRAIFACQRAIGQLLLDEQDAPVVISQLDRTLLDIRAGENQRRSFKPVTQIIGDAGGIDNFLSPKAIAGIPTPLTGLNAMLVGGGFASGQLIVIGARPAAGKTALAVNIGTFGVRQGKSVHIVSLEMEAAWIVRRAICSEAQVNLKVLSDRDAGKQQRFDVTRAIETLSGYGAGRLMIWDDSTASLMSLRAELRKEAVKNRVDMVIVDYLQLVEPESGRRDKNRNDAIGEISRGLKQLALELKCPIIALSQLSRESEKDDRRPRLSDLRESGSIEQDSDIVIFPWTKRIEGDPPSILDYELILAKQRNGPTGTVHVQFARKFTRFFDAGVSI